jgi:hypothetical protein
MAQVETIGGGTSYTPDGKKLTRQVYILTGDTTTVNAEAVAGATITSADFVDIGGGSKRVTITHTEGLVVNGGSASAPSLSGATSELIGGARELPTESHKTFIEVTEAQLREIKTAIQDNRALDTVIVPAVEDDKARILYNLLFRGQDYYLSPAVSYRETTLELEYPSLNELCTVNSPNKAPKVSEGQNWLLTSINGRSVASPTGLLKYEVTREWLLSDRKGWDPEKVIYDGT